MGQKSLKIPFIPYKGIRFFYHNSAIVTRFRLRSEKVLHPLLSILRHSEHVEKSLKSARSITTCPDKNGEVDKVIGDLIFLGT